VLTTDTITRSWPPQRGQARTSRAKTRRISAAQVHAPGGPAAWGWLPARACRSQGPGAPLPVPASPTAAQQRLRRRADGRVLVELRKAWRDGTTHLPFEPAEFLETLAAPTPQPDAHLLLYRGVLAPHAHQRRQIVGLRRSAASEEAAVRWAERGASRCPRCGGRLRLIATVEDPAVVGRILAHLGLLHPADSPGPAPPSDGLRAAASSHQ
jgi:hypothetical protein